MSNLLYKYQLIACYLSISTSLLQLPVMIIDQLPKPAPVPTPVIIQAPDKRIDHSEHRIHPYCQADGSCYLIYDML
jgi:hypothetical protein